MAGIFVQTVAFGSINRGIGLAQDLSTGLIERFRPLGHGPLGGPGRAHAGRCVRNLIVIVLMITVGFWSAWGCTPAPWPCWPSVALLLLFGFAMSWLMPHRAHRRERRGGPGRLVPPHGHAGLRLQRFVPVFADHQPVTATVNAVRALLKGGATAGRSFGAVAWSLAVVAVFAPLAIRRYRRTA